MVGLHLSRYTLLVLLLAPLAYQRMHAVLRGLALTLLLASQSVAFAMPSANAATSSSSSSSQKGGQGEAVGFGGYEHIPESERAQEVKPGEVPLLPEPKAAAAADAGTPTLKLGETMKFAELGPIIVNSDGTTRRITNWSTMTDAEQAVTMRRIGKRNQERMADLKRDADEANGADASSEL
jgi:hypothetical protein